MIKTGNRYIELTLFYGNTRVEYRKQKTDDKFIE
jgi:hypothetical protein